MPAVAPTTGLTNGESRARTGTTAVRLIIRRSTGLMRTNWATTLAAATPSIWSATELSRSNRPATVIAATWATAEYHCDAAARWALPMLWRIGLAKSVIARARPAGQRIRSVGPASSHSSPNSSATLRPVVNRIPSAGKTSRFRLRSWERSAFA